MACRHEAEMVNMGAKSGKTVVFRINGVGPGFLREYGCHH